MRNKILRGIGFLSGLIIILSVLSAFMTPPKEVYNAVAVDKKISAFNEEPENTIDIIFTGDSEAYSAFCPSLIWESRGYTSYVCANSLQRLCDTYALIESAFETQSPKVIIIETNCIYRYPGIEKDSDDVTVNCAEKVFPILKYHSRWKSVIANYFGSESEYLSEKEEKGFKIRNGVKGYYGGEYMKETTSAKEIPEESIEYLQKIRDLCDKNGASLLFVSTPSPVNWNYSKHNGIQNYADKYDIPYIDLNLMNDEIKIDWSTDTKDKGNHLNVKGATKVSNFIAQYLKDNYDLTDHREDSAYSSWNVN